MNILKVFRLISALIFIAMMSACTSLNAVSSHAVNENNQENIRKLLSSVNITINKQIKYQLDKQQYGVEDYWASPSEVLNSGRGDCEDYAFLKRELLINLGVPKQQLKLLQVDVTTNMYTPNSKRATEPHMVLGYYRENSTTNPLILDNMHDRVAFLRSRTDFHTNYVFDESNVWRLSKTRIDKKVTNTDILPKFYALRTRQNP
jgi:predicted transglutaminase-like cysteine proteinase